MAKKPYTVITKWQGYITPSHTNRKRQGDERCKYHLCYGVRPEAKSSKHEHFFVLRAPIGTEAWKQVKVNEDVLRHMAKGYKFEAKTDK